MPLYDWTCSSCKVTVSIQRPIAQIDAGPILEDIVEVGSTCVASDNLEHDWERQIKAPNVKIPQHHRAAG